MPLTSAFKDDGLALPSECANGLNVREQWLQGLACGLV